jgi:hypothetical protein
LEVSDGKGGVAEQKYQILVGSEAGNQHPIFVSIPVTQYNLPNISNPASGNVNPNGLDLNLLLGEIFSQNVSLTLPTGGNTTGSADVVFVVDESGSMQGEHEWLSEMVRDLDAALKAKGITNNRYALAGFGGSGIREPGHLFSFGANFNLALSQFNANQPLGSANFTGVASPLVIQVGIDGTYILIVNSSATSGQIDYGFEVKDISNTPVIASGFNTIESGTIAAGQIVTYNLTASAGLPIYFDSLDVDNDPITVELRDSAGTSVFSINASSDRGITILPSSGNYTLTVRGSNSSSVGDYRFQLLDLSASADILTFNSPLSENLDAFVTQAYRFNGSIGQRLYYDASDADFDRVNVRLIAPSGTAIINSNSDQDRELFSLNESGTYYVLLESTEANTANYNFTLFDAGTVPTLNLDRKRSGG